MHLPPSDVDPPPLSLSSTTYASTRRRSPWALAWSREPRPSCEKRWSGHWPGRGGGVPVEEKRVVDHGDSGARSRRWRTGPVARGPVASRKKRTYPTDTPSPRPAELFASRRLRRGFVSVAPGLDPAKAATAPVIGIIIEFLPTDPCQTARGDASVPRTHDGETQGLAQLRPVHGLHAHRL